MIDIVSWNWDLKVSVDAAAVRPKARFQGLDYGRDFTLHGRVRAPHELRGKTVRITLSPFGPKVRFGRGRVRDLGTLMVCRREEDVDFKATLLLPEEAIPATATALATTWKHLDIWTLEESIGGARIPTFSFSADIHPNLQAWANAD